MDLLHERVIGRIRRDHDHSACQLLVGVAAANPSAQAVAIAGIAGVTPGAMSMAAGEYVSVSSQSDIERADIAREKQAIESDRCRIRGARRNLSASRPVSRHGQTGCQRAHSFRRLLRPAPLSRWWAGCRYWPHRSRRRLIIPVVLSVTVLTLALLGYLGARVGGAPISASLLRVVGWGIFAMAVTAGIGKFFGVRHCAKHQVHRICKPRSCRLKSGSRQAGAIHVSRLSLCNQLRLSSRDRLGACSDGNTSERGGDAVRI
ncbi:VIT1/CCC1 transporter family protein [Hyphomicrobium sp. MC8b]|uniref:VIT1/CCC1 transporter family protein n=1 Tax=Hyphomicrobium sp. MC8b TaxID=300273 RepID=UPI00391C87B5